MVVWCIEKREKMGLSSMGTKCSSMISLGFVALPANRLRQTPMVHKQVSHETSSNIKQNMMPFWFQTQRSQSRPYLQAPLPPGTSQFWDCQTSPARQNEFQAAGNVEISKKNVSDIICTVSPETISNTVSYTPYNSNIFRI